jgi:hypothetical protein
MVEFWQNLQVDTVIYLVHYTFSGEKAWAEKQYINRDKGWEMHYFISVSYLPSTEDITFSISMGTLDCC